MDTQFPRTRAKHDVICVEPESKDCSIFAPAYTGFFLVAVVKLHEVLVYKCTFWEFATKTL